HLMNGVSYMVPFIVVGGLLIAISLAIGGVQTPEGIVIPEDSFWKQIENIGNASFSFMVPILAGFIAVSIADRPGLVPGMIGGYIAVTGSFLAVRLELGLSAVLLLVFSLVMSCSVLKRLRCLKPFNRLCQLYLFPSFPH